MGMALKGTPLRGSARQRNCPAKYRKEGIMADLIHKLSDEELIQWYTGSQSVEMLNYILNEMILRNIV